MNQFIEKKGLIIKPNKSNSWSKSHCMLPTALKINDNNSITFVNINLKSNMFTLTRNIHVNKILSKASKKIEKNHDLIRIDKFLLLRLANTSRNN